MNLDRSAWLSETTYITLKPDKHAAKGLPQTADKVCPAGIAELKKRMPERK